MTEHNRSESTSTEWDDFDEFLRSCRLQTVALRRQKNSNSDGWQAPELDVELLASTFIKTKCDDELYAQNLYAALCNRQWQRADVWPLLSDSRWSCSWRYAGGIVSDLRGTGDYMDFYCSGILDPSNDKTDGELSVEDGRTAVPEGHVTSEIAEDLGKIGWIVLPERAER